METVSESLAYGGGVDDMMKGCSGSGSSGSSGVVCFKCKAGGRWSGLERRHTLHMCIYTHMCIHTHANTLNIPGDPRTSLGFVFRKAATFNQELPNRRDTS